MPNDGIEWNFIQALVSNRAIYANYGDNTGLPAGHPDSTMSILYHDGHVEKPGAFSLRRLDNNQPLGSQTGDGLTFWFVDIASNLWQ